MTLEKLLDRVVQRTGLTTAATEIRDQARNYVNQILAEVTPMTRWWWRDRTTTFATVASTRTYNPVSGHVTAWWSFVDETGNQVLQIVGPDSYDAYDPDRSEEGSPWGVLITGQDATTGYPAVDILPVPDDARTIRVRYQADIDEWTSSNDASDLLTLGIPRIMESVLLYGAVSLNLEENGDDTGADRESGNFSRVLDLALRQNLSMQGNRLYLPVSTPREPESLISVDNTLASP